MAEMQMDVNPEELTSPNSSEVEQQEITDSEVVENTVPDVQGNLRIALQKERERRKAAESQLRQVQYQAPVEQDDTVRRFINVEATTLINNKLLTDPSFKDRADLVQNEMQMTGKTLEDADNAVLARLFREMTLSQPESIETKPPKQIKTTATPESQPIISRETQEELNMFDDMAKSFGK